MQHTVFMCKQKPCLPCLPLSLCVLHIYLRFPWARGSLAHSLTKFSLSSPPSLWLARSSCLSTNGNELGAVTSVCRPLFQFAPKQASGCSSSGACTSLDKPAALCHIINSKAAALLQNRGDSNGAVPLLGQPHYRLAAM